MIKFASFLLLTISVISCKPRFEKEITTLEIEDHIAYLASDELKGRYPGTPSPHPGQPAGTGQGVCGRCEWFSK